jgi:hypothetical protein
MVDCKIERRILVTHSKLDLQTGDSSVERQEWVTRECGTPLFSDARACKSCLSGWTHEHNYPTETGLAQIIVALPAVDVAERVEAIEKLPEGERQPAREAWLRALTKAMELMDDRRDDLRRVSGWPKRPGPRARPARLQATADLDALDIQRKAISALATALSRRSRPKAFGAGR